MVVLQEADDTVAVKLSRWVPFDTQVSIHQTRSKLR